MGDALQELRVALDDVELAYLAAGPEEGPLAVCLHGFPDSAWTWRHLLPELAAAGYRAVAPWMRGYAPSGLAQPPRYQTGALAGDAIALHGRLGGDGRAVLVGSDWGAMAAYGAAAAAPERWRRVVTMAVPPAGSIATAFSHPAQLKRSWYVFFLQTPLAEAMLPLDDLRVLDVLWADWSPGYDAAEDLRHVKDALRDPAHLLAAISYYRSMLDPSRHDPALADLQTATVLPVPQPTLYLHGAQDGCMAREVLGDPLPFLGAGSREEVVEGTGHFLHLERPGEVNRLVLDFLAEAGA